MEVVLTDQNKLDKLNKDDEIIETYKSTYKGTSGTGFSKIDAVITLSSEDKAALDRFGVPDIREVQEFVLKDITTLGDFAPINTVDVEATGEED